MRVNAEVLKQHVDRVLRIVGPVRVACRVQHLLARQGPARDVLEQCRDRRDPTQLHDPPPSRRDTRLAVHPQRGATHDEEVAWLCIGMRAQPALEDGAARARGVLRQAVRKAPGIHARRGGFDVAALREVAVAREADSDAISCRRGTLGSGGGCGDGSGPTHDARTTVRLLHDRARFVSFLVVCIPPLISRPKWRAFYAPQTSPTCVYAESSVAK